MDPNLIIFGIPTLILVFLIAYQLLLCVMATGNRAIMDLHPPSSHFVVVVPAHNEEKVIARTLYSIFGLVYPRHLFELLVVADNCTDATAEIARELGAEVLTRESDSCRGKGYALRLAFDHILQNKKHCHAVIVIDADSLVSGNYLQVMNHYLREGSLVVQSSDLVLPQPGAWSSEMTRIGFLLFNYIRPLGRKKLGLDVGLRGNGMCFSVDVLKQCPWQAWSLTEDLEYGLELQLRGFRIDFAAGAVVWARMPAQASHAESQRARWEMGRLPLIKKYSGLLLRKFVRNRSFRYADSMISLIMPPLVNVQLLILVLFALAGIGWVAGLTPAIYGIIFFSLFVAGILDLLAGLYIAGADRHLYKTLCYIPVYALWKMKVYVKAFMGSDRHRWIRTSRES